MTNLIGGGGLGDAAMIFAALNSNESPVDIKSEDYLLTHVEVPSTLIQAIRDFYCYQGIRSNVLNIRSYDNWMTENRQGYDHFVAACWHGLVGREKGWRINSFPDITYDHVDDVDILISPSAGRSNDRRFTDNEFIEFTNNDSVSIITHFIPDGKVGEWIQARMKIGKALLATNVRDVVDRICSSSVVVGNSGFVTFLAGMAGKKVFQLPEKPASDYRTDPNWNVTEIYSLEEI